MQHSNTAGCILLKFYIKPQHTANVYNLLYVVSYRNSTSNHNMSHWRATSQGVVSYRNSTSNHNSRAYPNSLMSLYLIEILHQTTTVDGCAVLVLCVVSYRNSTSNHNPPKRKAFVPMLYLIEILHQTTTRRNVKRSSRCCILSKFYIKPQLCHGACYYTAVVSYRNSTSNHNCRAARASIVLLYLIEILHQTTTP